MQFLGDCKEPQSPAPQDADKKKEVPVKSQQEKKMESGVKLINELK